MAVGGRGREGGGGREEGGREEGGVRRRNRLLSHVNVPYIDLFVQWIPVHVVRCGGMHEA